MVGLVLVEERGSLGTKVRCCEGIRKAMGFLVIMPGIAVVGLMAHDQRELPRGRRRGRMAGFRSIDTIGFVIITQSWSCGTYIIRYSYNRINLSPCLFSLPRKFFAWIWRI